MKLDKPIKIHSISYKINNKNIDNNYTVLNELDVTYNIRPKSKTITASIKHVPKTIVLALPSYYEAIENQINITFLNQLLSHKLGPDPEKTINDLFPYSLHDYPYGVGSVFYRLLNKYGIKINANCKCLAYLHQMNKNGHNWCKSNKNSILDKLKQESSTQKISYNNSIALKLLEKALDISYNLTNKYGHK